MFFNLLHCSLLAFALGPLLLLLLVYFLLFLFLPQLIHILSYLLCSSLMLLNEPRCKCLLIRRVEFDISVGNVLDMVIHIMYIGNVDGDVIIEILEMI